MILNNLKGKIDYMLCYPDNKLHRIDIQWCWMSWICDELDSTIRYFFLLMEMSWLWSTWSWFTLPFPWWKLSFLPVLLLRKSLCIWDVFLYDLTVERHDSDAKIIYYDSIAALANTKHSKYHSKTKFIEVRYNFITDMVAQKEMILKHIPMS